MLTLHQGSQTMGQALSLQINFHYTLLIKRQYMLVRCVLKHGSWFELVKAGPDQELFA